jgi:hypothetical protein
MYRAVLYKKDLLRYFNIPNFYLSLEFGHKCFDRSDYLAVETCSKKHKVNKHDKLLRVKMECKHFMFIRNLTL